MALTTDTLLHLLQTDGLLLLFPLAVIEGPIVTVIAGWLVRLGYLAFGWSLLVLVIADLVGDSLLYGLGRWGIGALSPRWRTRLGLTADRLARVSAHFDRSGGWTIVAAKLTHALGFPTLVAAGAGRMAFLPFIMFNLAGTIPKSLLLLLLGYALGEAHVAINAWIGRGSLVILLIAIAALGIWFLSHRRQPS